MSALAKKIDRMPVWAWAGMGAGAGTLAAGVLTLVQLLGFHL
jgi:hypothetical protein